MRHCFLFLAVAILAACHADPGEEPVPSQTLTLKAVGLWKTANPLDAPPGALSNALNTVIRRPGVAEKRRGNAPDATFTGQVLSVTDFEGLKVVHTTANTLARRNANGTVTVYSGTYAAPSATEPVRFAQAGGALYFTTAAGVYRLDAVDSTPVLAGEPPGLEGSATTTGSSGWLPGGTLASGTVSLGGGAGNVTVVVNGTSVGPVAFNASDAQTALDTITAINANGTLSPLVTASSGGSAIILIKADLAGSAGNYSLTASRTAGTAIASGTTLTGGAAGSTVGYRVLWGRRDEDGAVIVGAPSGRMLVTNATGATRDTTVTTPIPPGIIANVDFLQVQRTVLVATAGDDPGEDMAQVLEVFPTQAQITAGTFTVTDIAPYANGPTAYFSPSRGPGLADTRERPPLVTDLVPFKGYMFGVAEEYRASLSMALLSVNGSNGLTINEGITISDGTTTEIYYCNGVPSDEGTQPGPGFRIFYKQTTGTVAQNLEVTAQSLVRVLNGYSSLVTATYTSATDDLPGQFVLTERDVDADPIYVRGYKNNQTWTPGMRQEFTASPTRVGTTVTVTTPGNPHRLRVDETVTLVTGSADFPPGNKTVTGTPAADVFTYTEAGPAAAGLSMAWVTGSDEVYLDQEAVQSSWAHSAYQEYDGWPPRFRFNVQGTNPTLYRITPQGDALVFWTSEGLYRLTGDDENSFTLKPLDTTYILVGGNTPVTVGGKAYGLTTRGLVSVVDESAAVVSGPVEELLNDYYSTDSTNLDLTSTSAFGVGNEGEQEYMLFLPDLATAGSGDPAALAYVYNAKTQTWVGPWEWEWAGINTGTKFLTTGMVGSDGRLWLASSTRLTQERKARALADYQDATGVGIPQDVTYQVQTANNPGLYKQWVETTALLEAPQPAEVDVAFTTELASTPEGATLPSQGNLALRTYIPRNMSRSSRLSVSLQHDASSENMSVLGLSVVYNAPSTKVGR